jgi:hypothetical protein
VVILNALSCLSNPLVSDTDLLEDSTSNLRCSLQESMFAQLHRSIPNFRRLRVVDFRGWRGEHGFDFSRISRKELPGKLLLKRFKKSVLFYHEQFREIINCHLFIVCVVWLLSYVVLCFLNQVFLHYTVTFT